MPEVMACWSCGRPVEGLSLPMRRLEECPDCHADLHVCRMCQFYARDLAKRCREPDAEEVKDKERANFCDYFKPGRGAGLAREQAEARAARAQLEGLFGIQTDQGGSGSKPSEADEARARLEELFGTNKPDD